MSNPLDRIITERAEDNGAYAIAYALLRVADQLKWLGTGDAATTMGAIEMVGAELQGVGNALNAIAEAIGDQQ